MEMGCLICVLGIKESNRREGVGWMNFLLTEPLVEPLPVAKGPGHSVTGAVNIIKPVLVNHVTIRRKTKEYKHMMGGKK